MTVLAGLGRFGLFLIALARGTLSHPPPLRRTLEEAYTVGVRSLPVLLLISAFVGTNLAFQGFFAFKEMGGQHMVGMFVALAGVREMAPIMVSSMIAAKAGTEMASQLAVMRIRDQIDALEVMSVDPYWYLITPRLFGTLLVLPALTMLALFTVIWAGWLVVEFQLHQNGSEYLTLAWATVRPADLLFAAIKAFQFGVVIALVCCYFGFHSESGPTGVGAATNKAVVFASVFCAIFNYFLSEMMYG